MAPYLCGVDPVVGNNTLVVLTTIFGGGFEVWVCDGWYYGIQPWRLWALGSLEEGGADFCVCFMMIFCFELSCWNDFCYV